MIGLANPSKIKNIGKAIKLDNRQVKEEREPTDIDATTVGDVNEYKSSPSNMFKPSNIKRHNRTGRNILLGDMLGDSYDDRNRNRNRNIYDDDEEETDEEDDEDDEDYRNTYDRKTKDRHASGRRRIALGIKRKLKAVDADIREEYGSDISSDMDIEDLEDLESEIDWKQNKNNNVEFIWGVIDTSCWMFEEILKRVGFKLKIDGWASTISQTKEKYYKSIIMNDIADKEIKDPHTGETRIIKNKSMLAKMKIPGWIQLLFDIIRSLAHYFLRNNVTKFGSVIRNIGDDKFDEEDDIMGVEDPNDSEFE